MSKSISCNQYLFIWWRKHQYDCILWHEIASEILLYCRNKSVHLNWITNWK